MSAREDLEQRLIRDAGLSPHWAKRQVDAFAHELAEKQRALRDRDPWIARSVLIDQIDPEAS